MLVLISIHFHLIRKVQGHSLMNEKLPVVVVGGGRIGNVHAQHVLEHPDARLAAIVDPREEVLSQWRVPGFQSLESFLADGPQVPAAVVASPTALHRAHVKQLVESGVRVMVEKPLTSQFEEDAAFADWLSHRHPQAVMLAFQRRFDEPLLRLQSWLREGRIGRAFKFVSILEDSRLMPDGYESPGLLQDMSVHNVDELLWLAESDPVTVRAQGHRLFSHAHTSVEEDFDDASMEIAFSNGALGQIFVSRNHVAGYRVETWVFGESGVLHVGGFRQNRHEVVLERYELDRPGERETFALQDYGESVPEFLDRFGGAYAQELDDFIGSCRSEGAFRVDHEDAKRASRALRAGAQALQTGRVESVPS